MTELPLIISKNYIYYKIFVLLFCSLFILACSNDVGAPTTNITDVALHSLERSVNTKEGETFRFVFELNKTSIKDVVFDWYLQHHSTSADDFTGALAGTKRIIAGSTTTDIVIDTSDDNIYEGNESFTLSIINVIRAVPDSLSVVASIIDKDQPIILFKQDNTALEAASFNYRLRLNKASIKDVVFDWFIQHHSTSSSDFRGALAGSQLIRAGSTTATISIDTSDDTIYEGNEDFTLHITNVTGATPDSLLVDSSIIDDQDKPIISFKQDSTTTEGASLSYSLQLNQASALDASFDWYLQHSSTSTGDFRGALAGSQLIRAGDTTATISIDTSDDNIYEGNEDFTLHITNVIGATPDALVASGSIIENDPQPTIVFEQATIVALEGNMLVYRLQLNRVSVADVSFDWYLQHSSTSSSDFRGVTAGRQQIRAGDTTTAISIDTSDDNIYEGNEDFTLHITNVTGATPDALVASGSIIENDPQPTIVFEQATIVALEGNMLVYRLQLNRVSVADVSFDWYLQHSSTSTSDFRGVTAGRQQIRAGDTTTAISIDTSNDTIYEGNEDFSLNIINVTGASPSALVADGRIIDSDVQPTIDFEQDYSSVTEGGSLSYTLQLTNTSTTDISFDWLVQHSSTSTSDFTGIIASSQRIAAGDTTATISIDTSNDTIYEGNEDFTLHITNVTGATPDALVADGRIIDSDVQPTIDFEQDYSSVTEGGSLSYTLQLTHTSTRDIAFDWYLQHSSTSTSDFTGIIADSQQIRAGDTTTTISIDTSDDSIYEGDESFVLHITNIRGATPDRLEAGGRIIDNDPQPTIDFEQDYSSVTEGGSLNYTLQLTNTSTTDISFDWLVQHSSTSTSDFTGAIFGTQLIRAGDTSTTISIDTSDDSIYETDEIFTLNIINVIGATPDRLEASGSIIENDPQPIISFEQDSTATEGASLSYRLQLNKASALDVSFDWFVQHSSTSTSDFTGALAGTKRIRAGSTTTDIVIDTSNDTIYETDEIFTLNITNIRGATPDRLEAGGRIIENDPQPTIDFEQDYSSVTEGGSLSYILQLNKASALDVSFDWYLQHHSTIAEDFTGALAGTKRIRAGSTTTDIVIDTSDDLIPELAEDFTLHITNIRGATPDSLSTLIIIAESDIGISVDYDGNGLIDIVTQEYLDHIRYNLAGTSYKTSASDASVKCGGSDCRGYELLANLDLSSFANWQPIGSQNDPFTSILQGNGYSIANLAIDRGNNIGLFAALSGATIDNLLVEVASIAGDSDVGALAGRAENSAISRLQVRAVNASSKLSATGANIGGILGAITGTTITNVTSDLSIVGGNDDSADNVGGIVGYVSSSDISYATSSGSVSASGGVDFVGGLLGQVNYSSTVSYSSASGSVTSSGDDNRAYGGLVGTVRINSNVSYSSASGSVISSGENNNNYGGLAGRVEVSSKVSYSSASGSVTSSGDDNKNYGGLVGFSAGEVRHSWSSSSVFASNPAGLVGNNKGNNKGDNTGSLKFSYALGFASYGLVATNEGTIINSYWNSETSGALLARDIGSVTNIGFSDTDGMLASTGFAGATIFQGFADATDEHNRNIWTFASGNYPVITELGLDKQAVSLAYGLLRLASPYVSDNTLNSFLGGTLNNKDIELIANSYNVNGTLAILDVNLLQSNSAICAAGSTDTIMTTTGANGATIALQKIAGSIEIEKSPSNSCEIIFSNQKTDGTLQLAAIISKGAASLTKKFEITLNAIQSIITLQPTTLITSEGDKLVFTLELNHRASRALSFDWYIQHNSTSTSDFTGARSGFEEISAGDTTATIELQINDDRRPERAEDFNLHITNIRGVTHNNLSASITILENDLDVTPDYDGNGFIDLVTQEHFDNIRHNLAGTSYKTSISDAGKTCGGGVCRGYELLANLDLSTFANWQPIGSQHNPFTSILQGNGYSITNLAIDGGDYLGLFSALSGATIDNLVVEVASITGDNDVGALAGMAENSAISRVQIRAVDASSTLSATGANIGGMLGAITGTTITNVTSDLSIVGGNTENADNVGGIVGYVSSSTISYATSSGSVSASGGADNVGGLVGLISASSDISYSSSSSSVSSSVSSSGNSSEYYGGLVGLSISSDISYSSASGSVSSSGNSSKYYGGLVGGLTNSIISDSSASSSVTNSGTSSKYYGGLVGGLTNSIISDSSASGSVSNSGIFVQNFGGLVGVLTNSTISYSSASVSVSSSVNDTRYFGGLAGELTNSTISYSSASGSVSSSAADSNYYGGLAGHVDSSSAISNSSASGSISSSSFYGGLVGLNSGNLGFSYALGVALYGLVATNTGTIKNSYWNIETSGALKATDATDNIINIASSDTAGMLASTGSTNARIFKGFFDATDEHNRNIWTFADDSYPVITELGIDEQAVALAYGLLRLAHPTATGRVSSFLGGTLHNENIELEVADYSANDTLAILDVNLLQSSRATCTTSSTSSIITTRGANQAVITLSITAATNNLHEHIVYTDCSIAFDRAAVIQAGDRLQLAAIITKGSASLSKKFVINFQ